MKMITTLLVFSISWAAFTADFIIPDNSEVHQIWNQNIFRTENPNEFNLLIWNIKKLQRKKMKRDLKNLSQNADLMLIQEFANNKTLDEYWKTFRKHQIDFSMSFRKVKDGEVEYETGVANFTNLIMDEFYWIRSEGEEPFLHTPKMFNIVTFKMNNKSLMLVNLHFINFVRDVVYIREMDRLTNLIEYHQGPLMVAGDYNCWKKDRKKAMAKMAGRLKLKFVKFPEREKIWGTLDHVLYRGVQILDPHELVDYSSSDHKPMTMKVIVD